MNQEILTPAEITAKSTESAIEKTSKAWYKILMSGMLAGMYIGIGAMFSLNTISGMDNFAYGIVKLVSGVMFSIGLILVMVAGADLFTGDALMITAVLDKKLKLWRWGIHLLMIWLSNFIGALLLVGLLHFVEWEEGNDGKIAEAILAIGTKKILYDWSQALVLGILCNLLVCLGVWLAWAGKRLADKAVGIIFPVSAFVACGFEHSVANMFYLPYAWILGLQTNIEEMLWDNFIPVTIGNLIGGAIFLGMIYWVIYHQKEN